MVARRLRDIDARWRRIYTVFTPQLPKKRYNCQQMQPALMHIDRHARRITSPTTAALKCAGRRRTNVRHDFVGASGQGESLEMDAMYLILGTVFFALSWGLVVLCDSVRN